jgi:hypothetical protein
MSSDMKKMLLKMTNPLVDLAKIKINRFINLHEIELDAEQFESDWCLNYITGKGADLSSLTFD